MSGMEPLNDAEESKKESSSIFEEGKVTPTSKDLAPCYVHQKTKDLLGETTPKSNKSGLTEKANSFKIPPWQVDEKLQKIDEAVQRQ